MQLPTYLVPYTKSSFTETVKERDKALAQRCREVGKIQTVEETGWSVTAIIRACQENSVPNDPRGPRQEKQHEHVTIGKCSNFSEIKNVLNPPIFSENSIPTDFLKIADELKRCNSTEFEQLIRSCKARQEFTEIFFKVQQPKDKRNARKKKQGQLVDCVYVDQPEILPPNSGKIFLSKNLFAIVDLDMIPVLERFTWSAKSDYRSVYAVSTDIDSVQFKMHRFVLGLPNKSGGTIDHINHNAVDNRRCNLRVVTNSENQFNRKEHNKYKSRFYGVSWWTGKWGAYLKVDGKAHKKYFEDEIEAAKYYDELVRQHKGPDHPTNESRGLFKDA